nr:hypothetical protein [Tanacetum cinerariifolium]
MESLVEGGRRWEELGVRKTKVVTRWGGGCFMAKGLYVVTKMGYGDACRDFMVLGARFYVMQCTLPIQGIRSIISMVSIRPEGLMPSILLLIVAIVIVVVTVILVVVVVTIVRVVIVVVIIGVVVRMRSIISMVSISLEGFLPFILLLVVIIVAVILVVVVIDAIVGVVIVVASIGVVVVVMIIGIVMVDGGVSHIIKLSFVIIVTFPSMLWGSPPMKASIIFSVFGTMFGHKMADSWNLLTQAVEFIFHFLDLSSRTILICQEPFQFIPPGQGIIGVSLGLVFLLGLLVFSILAACASRAEAIPSAISCRMAAKVMAGVSDVNVLLGGIYQHIQDDTE